MALADLIDYLRLSWVMNIREKVMFYVLPNKRKNLLKYDAVYCDGYFTNFATAVAPTF